MALRKKTIFLSAQPDVPYFHWQVEVMIHNFIKVGINPNWIEVLWATDGPMRSPELNALAMRYPHVRFFSYQKTITENHGYIPILRPDIIEQHYKRFPDLRGETIFYHDSDIIFKTLPDFDSMHSDLYWYLSDTVSYIGANYIKSKSNDLFIDLCSLTQTLPELVEKNQENSGGAQYLMKGTTAQYWKKVKEDSLALYKYMADRERLERETFNQDQLKGYNPIQKWCADMWAVLWGAWSMGAQTLITQDLDFSWGTSHISDWEKCNIMHNAGVTSNNGGRLFYKGEFIGKSPFDSDLSTVDPTTASSKYVEAIQYAKDQRIPLLS
jgi:hypothetical protein